MFLVKKKLKKNEFFDFFIFFSNFDGELYPN